MRNELYEWVMHDVILNYGAVAWSLVLSATPAHIGIIAGVLQALGYAVYVRKSLRHEIEPNAATWLMFAYGTALLTVLEWDSAAPWYLLILPVTCSVLSIGVAYICWRRNTLRWPKHPADRSAFLIDIALTAGYAYAWWLSVSGKLSTSEKDLAVLCFLLLSNAATVTAFVPLIRASYQNPDREHVAAWSIWTLAYTMLGVSTWMLIGKIANVNDLLFQVADPSWRDKGILMLYPLSNAMMHGAVALLARSSRHGGRKMCHRAS